MTDSAPWLGVAEKEKGTREVAGDGNNPRILEYAKLARIDWYKFDSVPWCAIFVGAILVLSGLPSTGSALANSYINYGSALHGPKVGAICVLRRGSNPMQGHVGLVLSWTDTEVLILGGNQNDQVCEKWFPRDDVRAYRWPVALPKENDNAVEAPRKPETSRTTEPGINVRPVQTIPIPAPKRPESSSSPPQRSDEPEGSRTIATTERLEEASKVMALVVAISTAVKSLIADIGIVGQVGLALIMLLGCWYVWKHALNIRAFRIEDHQTGKHTGR